MKNLVKIDKFYFVLVVVLIILSAVFIFAFRGIFTAFVTAYEVSSQTQQNIKVDTIKLQKAIELLDKDMPTFVEADNNRLVVPTPSVAPTNIPALTTTPAVTNVVQ